MMVYYGYVFIENGNADVYGVLMEALWNTTIETPYRGPVAFEKGDWRYENKVEGEVGNFSGTEKIYRGAECVYEAKYVGGFVDC
jgi:hypothetical protein